MVDKNKPLILSPNGVISQVGRRCDAGWDKGAGYEGVLGSISVRGALFWLPVGGLSLEWMR